MLDATTKANFKLFNRAAGAEDDPTKVYPIMNGFLENKDFRLNVAAFFLTNKTTGEQIKDKGGNAILSLAIGNTNEETFYGTLYKDLKPGKEGSYYGYIDKSVDTGEVDEEGKKIYAKLWQLSIAARRHVPEDPSKKKYIGGDVYPNKAATAKTGTTVTDDDFAF